jgi:hypothetical protein
MQGDDVSRFFTSHWHFSILLRLHLKFSRARFYQNNTIKREAHIKISRHDFEKERPPPRKSRRAHTLPQQPPRTYGYLQIECFYYIGPRGELRISLSGAHGIIQSIVHTRCPLNVALASLDLYFPRFVTGAARNFLVLMLRTFPSRRRRVCGSIFVSSIIKLTASLATNLPRQNYFTKSCAQVAEQRQ